MSRFPSLSALLMFLLLLTARDARAQPGLSPVSLDPEKVGALGSDGDYTHQKCRVRNCLS